MNEQRNLILAVVLAVVILFGFDFMFGSMFAPPPAPKQSVEQVPETPAPGRPAVPEAGQPGRPGVPGAAAPASPSRAEAVGQAPRVRIETPSLGGSISLRGARIDDVTLVNYHESPDPESPRIELLSPTGTANPYYAEFGWVAQGVALPDADTVWEADSQVLTPDNPVTLTWDNGEGMEFTRTISVDADFMFTVRQTVRNTGAEPVSLYPYGLISRTGTPPTAGFFILHEGMLGVLDGTLKEIDYDDIQDDGTIQQKATGGWLGITDKYWLTALVPDQGETFTTRFTHFRVEGVNKYQTDYVGEGITVAPGSEASAANHFFAGAKVMGVLDGYAEQYNVQRFDLAIDFGWFYFLTKPIFWLLTVFYHFIGNFGVAILLLTVLIKLAMFPLANKSYISMSKMKQLQPQMLKLRERFGDDKARLNQEMMALYKREKVNPASGCLPILVQIPVFFALYKVLFVNIEMRHAPFFGWIQDLSAPDPTTVFNLFGLIPWTPPDFLMLGVWPLIMGFTMWLQQKLNPAPTDPVQAKVMMFLPVIFTFLLAQFPAGLVIYWAWNNALSILQQWVIMRKMGVKVG